MPRWFQKAPGCVGKSFFLGGGGGCIVLAVDMKCKPENKRSPHHDSKHNVDLQKNMLLHVDDMLFRKCVGTQCLHHRGVALRKCRCGVIYTLDPTHVFLC